MDADLADFITVDGRIDDTGKQYELTTALTWYADRDDAITDAHGTLKPDGKCRQQFCGQYGAGKR